MSRAQTPEQTRSEPTKPSSGGGRPRLAKSRSRRLSVRTFDDVADKVARNGNRWLERVVREAAPADSTSGEPVPPAGDEVGRSTRPSAEDHLLVALETARRYLRSKNFDAGSRDGVAFVIESAIAKAGGSAQK